jgi:hypothetical protein
MAMTVLASGHEGDIQSEFHNLSIRTLSDRTVLTAQGVGNQRISVSIDDRDQVLLHTRTGISDCGSAEIVEDTKSGMATLTASCDDSGQTEIAATVPATIL